MGVGLGMTHRFAPSERRFRIWRAEAFWNSFAMVVADRGISVSSSFPSRKIPKGCSAHSANVASDSCQAHLVM